MEILTRFKKRATASNLVDSILEKLAEFGLSIGDFCGITTDGDTTMIKLGKLMIRRAYPEPFYHQQCFAHCLHLGVRDTLPYPEDEKKPWKLVAIAPQESEGDYPVESQH